MSIRPVQTPFLTPMKLASDFGCIGLDDTTAATAVLGSNGSLVKKSAIDAAVAANEMVLINTEGVQRLVVKCMLRDVVGSGSGGTRCKFHFFGLIPSGEGTATSDALDNPWFASRTEMFQNTLVDGDFTGVSNNPPVVSQTGHEFLNHHDWDHGAVETALVWGLNFEHRNRANNTESVNVGTPAEVASTNDNGNFVIINTVAPFDLCAFTFDLGSLTSGIANLYYSSAH